MVFVSGLNFEKIRHVIYALRDDKKLSQVYYSTVYLVVEFYTLLATEMRSVKRDILYWEVLAESTPWEIFITQLHNKIYRRIVEKGYNAISAVIPKPYYWRVASEKTRVHEAPTIKVSIDCMILNVLMFLYLCKITDVFIHCVKASLLLQSYTCLHFA